MTPTYDPTPREDEREEEFANRIRMSAIGLGEAGRQEAEKLIEADAEVGRKLAFLNDESDERLGEGPSETALRDIRALEQRMAFDSGARAMQQRIVAGIRLWWSAAPAGHRHPGHPHILEVRVRDIKVEELEGRP